MSEPRPAAPDHTMPRQAVPYLAIPGRAKAHRDAASYHEKLQKALARAGGLYELPDLLERIADGRMQAHVSRETIAVTEISVYPRRRVLTIIILVGDLEDGESLHAQVLDFARKMECDAIVTQGRVGWAHLAKSHGWKTVSKNMVFRKEVSP